jgi:subtilisin family serine protease
MKKLIITLGLVLLYLISNAQTPYYYYYEGKKQFLSLNTGCAFISLKDQQLPADIKQRNVRVKELKSDKSDKKQYQKQKRKNRFYTEINFEDKMSDEQYLKLLADIKNKNKDIIISPYFKIKDNDTIGLSNFFYVKLKSIADTTLLTQLAVQTSCIIIEQDAFMPQWFVLSTAEISEHNAMECSNIFYESGLFLAAEPNLMINIALCANDTYFSQQWGLSNTGQYSGTKGVDIRACDAWALSKGNNVKVAVIDQGIELNHPDLTANIYPLSYDTGNRTSPSNVYGDHATAVAGILGAVQNNSLGISGVAPNCQLISISNSLVLEINSQQNLAAGIN